MYNNNNNKNNKNITKGQNFEQCIGALLQCEFSQLAKFRNLRNFAGCKISVVLLAPTI